MTNYQNSKLNVNASEFISILSLGSSLSSRKFSSDLNAEAPEFNAPLSAPLVGSPPGLSRAARPVTWSSAPGSKTFYSPPPCNIQSWWYENKSLFDDSYDDMKKIFGWSKVPLKKVLKVGELAKLNVEKVYPSKKITSQLHLIKEESSYAAIVLRRQNILH